MAFNLHQFKEAAEITEKQMRDEDAGKEKQLEVAEKKLPDRWNKDTMVTTEAQLDDRTAEKDERVTEKRLNEDANRDDSNVGIRVPPIHELVAKLRSERMEEYKVDQKPDWTVTQSPKDQKAQRGDLPSWPKRPSQPKPLALGITTADVDRVADGIKTGKSLDYDTAIVAILQQADKESRELSSVEQKAIADLKIARTAALIKQ
jgi:hypothetical protein